MLVPPKEKYKINELITSINVYLESTRHHFILDVSDSRNGQKPNICCGNFLHPSGSK